MVHLVFAKLTTRTITEPFSMIRLGTELKQSIMVESALDNRISVSKSHSVPRLSCLAMLDVSLNQPIRKHDERW